MFRSTRVYKLGAVFQIVDNQNVGDAFVIQRWLMLLPIKPAPPVTMIITVPLKLRAGDNPDMNALIISPHEQAYSHSQNKVLG